MIKIGRNACACVLEVFKLIWPNLAIVKYSNRLILPVVLANKTRRSNSERANEREERAE